MMETPALGPGSDACPRTLAAAGSGRAPVKMSWGSHHRCRGEKRLRVNCMIIVHLLVSSYSPVRLRQGQGHVCGNYLGSQSWDARGRT